MFLQIRKMKTFNKTYLPYGMDQSHNKKPKNWSINYSRTMLYKVRLMKQYANKAKQ